MTVQWLQGFAGLRVYSKKTRLDKTRHDKTEHKTQDNRHNPQPNEKARWNTRSDYIYIYIHIYIYIYIYIKHGYGGAGFQLIFVSRIVFGRTCRLRHRIELQETNGSGKGCMIPTETKIHKKTQHDITPHS